MFYIFSDKFSGVHLSLPYEKECFLAFSRCLCDLQITEFKPDVRLIVHNIVRMSSVIVSRFIEHLVMFYVTCIKNCFYIIS